MGTREALDLTHHPSWFRDEKLIPSAPQRLLKPKMMVKAIVFTIYIKHQFKVTLGKVSKQFCLRSLASVELFDCQHLCSCPLKGLVMDKPRRSI